MKYRLLFIALVLGVLSCAPVKFTTDTSSDGGGAPCNGSVCVNTSGPTLWVVNAWGSCSKACGTGTQSRNVSCLNVDAEVIPDRYCNETKPSTIQDCNTQSCDASGFSWNLGVWGSCSVSCGGGTQTRAVTCQSTSGTVADTNCLEIKPPTTQTCNTTACAGNLVDKTMTVTANSLANKVDILLVVDDSSSMSADNQKLAQRMATFVSDLQSANLDWQMCITTTDVDYYGGAPIVWSGVGSHILKANSGSLSSIFQQTIYDIGSGYSNDEQGIKASILNMLNYNYNSTLVKDKSIAPCYRSGTSHAVVLISDEDERSVGGVYSLSGAQYKDMGYQNQPSSYVTTARNTFGASRKYAFNAIVVKDSTCEAQQDSQGSPSFIGQRYMELVSLTDGHAGSICDADYVNNFQYFKEAILEAVTEVTLDCSPNGTPSVTFSPNNGNTFTVEGSKMKFSPAIGNGTTVTISYKCQI